MRWFCIVQLLATLISREKVSKRIKEIFDDKIIPKFSHQSSVDTSRNSINGKVGFGFFVHLLSIYHQLWSHLGKRESNRKQLSFWTYDHF